MKLIQDNPYRIAGILANASEREVVRQKSKISKSAGIGRQVDSELDFPFMNTVDRTDLNSVNKAFSGIEQNQDKVSHSLFWFIKANTFDETAINYLINGDKEKALEIWDKVTNGKEVTSKNFSCFNNIGTLKLLSESQQEIKEGLEAKIKLIESPSFSDFVHTVADQTYTIDNQKQAEKFVDDVLKQFKGKYSSSDTLKLFSNCNGTTQKYLSQKFTEEPLHKIESQIESTKNKRKTNKSGAYELGLKLFVNCKDDLATLKSLLGTSDLKYKMIADNLAKEVMQCGIDYFQEWKESKNPSEEGLKLLKYAQSIAIGSQTKERIKENIEGMQEWAETAPIKDDLNFITNKLKNFQNAVDSIENAKSLISSCKSKLQNIKNILGSSDELYLNVSSAVVSNALGMIIEVVNDAQSGLDYNRAKLLVLPSIVSDAVSAISLMDSLDMNSQTRRRFSENKATINSINTQLDSVRRQIRSATSSSSSSGSSGCYIATMAYGDYDHPQVMELRKFRDEFLNKSLLGRIFISLYYKYSPLLVQRLKDKPKTNDIIRTLLDQLIKIIR
jgi:hypothetical protein